MNRLYIIILFQLLFYNSEAQSLQSKVIPFEGNPTVTDIKIIDNYFIISTISFIDNTSGSTFIDIDLEFETIRSSEFKGFSVNIGGVLYNNQKLYVFGNNNNQAEFVTLLELDEDYTQAQEYNFTTNSVYNFTSNSILLDNHIYSLSVDFFLNPERRESFIQKIDLDGNEIWNRTKDKNEVYTNGIDLKSTQAGDLLIGASRILDGKIYGELIKMNQQGDEIWSTISTEHSMNGYSFTWSTELSDNNIVSLSTVDRRTDTEFLMNGWSNRPLKITWLDPEGVPYRDTLLITNKEEHYTLSRIKKGAGDYFFIYGARQNPNFLNGDYGWLCKMSNDGEILWNRTYHVTGLMETGHFHNIKDIEEMDNGDIVTIGTALKPGESQQIWAMRINADGCFSDGECGDISTATEDIRIPRERINIYPNPSNGLIQFDYGDIPSSDLASISVLNMSGANVHEQKGGMQDYLSLDHLPKGVYFVQFKFKSGRSLVEKVVLD